MAKNEKKPEPVKAQHKEREIAMARTSAENGVKRKQLKNKLAKFIATGMLISVGIIVALAYITIDCVTKGTFTINQSIGLLIVVGLLVCMLATLILNGLIKRIVKPILEVAQEVRLLHKGDFSSKFTAHADDTEIGEMVQGIELMRNSLKDVIEDVTNCCTELSKGNFTVETSAEYAGDLSKIKVALSNTIDILRTLVSQVGATSDKVAIGSDQVSLGAQSVSQGTMQQASAIQQLSASIIEVSESVKNSANGAAAAEQLTNKVGEEMNVSDQNMKKMIVAMQEISNSSSEIGKIIKTIEDIAFQTNILALNAAVEAARAGTAGKGFAVVADEVRNLATKSAEAAKDTTSLIEHSIAAVENGTKIANTTAVSLQAVVEGTKELITQIDLIAREVKEEEASIREITQGIDQVSGVVQTNSATAEQSAAASEELSAQANVLKELVSKFQVEKGKETKGTFSTNKSAKENQNQVHETKPLIQVPQYTESVQIETMVGREEAKAVQKEIAAYTPAPKTKSEPAIRPSMLAKKEPTPKKPSILAKREPAPKAEPKPVTVAKPTPTPKPTTVNKSKDENEEFEPVNGKTINDYSDKY